MCVNLNKYCLYKTIIVRSFVIYKKLELYEIQKDGDDNPVCETAKETQMYRTVFWTLWERARVGWFGRISLKHVYYHM